MRWVFANAPALLGGVEFVENDKRYAIAAVHALVENQGDGWTVSSAYLDRFIDDHRVLASNQPGGESGGAGPLSALHVASGLAHRRAASCAVIALRPRRFRAGADGT